MRGFLTHLGLTLRLNFASKQPLVYGYIVPVFFLIAFGAVFRAGRPPLLHQMGQLVTISALGSACFGLPTALVAERERGWWRRYRLLPGALAPLLASTLTARFLLMASAGALQLGLARIIYGTPFPEYGIHFAAAYAGTAVAFLGLGLLVAALADDVPAVQALGQCLFLPLIMIGGVGIPLSVLPAWAQGVAAFLPGRYAVQALEAGYSVDSQGAGFGFDLAALVAVGICAGLAGAVLFRWDNAPRLLRPVRGGLAAALVPWLAVGLIALRTDRWRAEPDYSGTPAWAITAAQIDGISYADLPPDDGIITPLAPPAPDLSPPQRERLRELRARLEVWPPGRIADADQAMRNLLSVAAIADLAEDPLEGSIARTVLAHLRAHFPPGVLDRGLAWAILDPQGGRVLGAAPELDLGGTFGPESVRPRVAIYATKFLGRIRGRIADEPSPGPP